MLKVSTYEEILQFYLSRLPKDMDKREGTVAYIIGSALAIRLAELYVQMKTVEDDCYFDTATGQKLEYAAAILRLERRDETKAVVRMEGDTGFTVGAMFKGGENEYKIISVEDGYYLAECTLPGEKGNDYIGEVLPKDDRTEFSGMNIVSIVAKGEGKEDDESLRKRCIERLNCPICAGNLSYYKEAVNSIAGVGGIKVVPVADGIGTVKVIITNSDYSVASEDLIKYVKSVLDPEETSGQGCGLVPVGHSVTVDTVEKVDVDLVVEFKPENAQSAYCMFGREYLPGIFAEINKTWDSNDYLVLRDRVIEDYFFSLGAKDVNIVSINGETNRLILEPNQILGGIKINGN